MSQSSTFREWIYKKLEINDAPYISLTQLIFALTARGLPKVFSPEHFHEEPITAALPGMLAAHAQWVVAAFERDVDETPAVYWSHYKKNTTAEERDGLAPKIESERMSGADFALIVRLDSANVLMSLFQAKRAKAIGSGGEKRLAFFTHHATSDAERPTQLETLVNYATSISKLASSQVPRGNPSHHSMELLNLPMPLINPDIRSLSWVHYLVYGDDEQLCVPLKSLASYHNEHLSLEARKRSHYVVLDDVRSSSVHLKQHFDLSKIMWPKMSFHGRETARPLMKGWLRMSLDEAQALLPKLNTLTGVDLNLFVADVATSTNRLLPDPPSMNLRLMSEEILQHRESNPLMGLAAYFGDRPSADSSLSVAAADGASSPTISVSAPSPSTSPGPFRPGNK